MSATASGRRVASLRFKLTAWYAGLLALVLIALTVSVLRLAEGRLLTDMDARLFNTADDIAGAIGEALATSQVFGAPVRFDDVVPALGSFTSRGLLIQVVDAEGEVVRRSEAAPTDPLAAPPSADQPRRAERQIVEANGWRVRVVDYPLLLTTPTGEPRSIGAVVVGERMDTLQETLDSVRQVLLLTSALGLALAILGGWWLAGRALRPVDRITATAAAVAVGEGPGASLGRRLDVPPSGDELARLAATFNAMLDRLQAAFVAQRRFVADASHELRTPLAAIRGNTDVLARQVASLPDGGLRRDLLEAAADLQRESRRMGRLLDDLLLLARSDAAAAEGTERQRWAPVRLDEVAADAVRVAAGLADGQALRLETEPVTVLGDRDRLDQIALVLLDNALRATPPGSPVTVTARPDGPASVLLEVRDGGMGIASEHLPHVFDRFFRVDDVRSRRGGGSGLGLAIARAIVRSHGGEITAESVLGVGSVFRVRLPAVLTPTAPLDPATTSGPDPARPRHLLVNGARPPGTDA
ncbi:MAG: HAMP domain-containing protein [Chloroflexia bacterium]|nr:HAMP domain-containing protein [Chloroflexia bacterium]